MFKVKYLPTEADDTINNEFRHPCLSSCKREHMHYVALSRLRSISGLHILNMNENKIAVSKKVHTRRNDKIKIKSNTKQPYSFSL
jgi:hypothetical protein